MDAYLPAGQPTRLHIAFALVAPHDADVPPYPEAVVEPAAERYPVLVDHAWESGFGLAVGDPAETTAELCTHDGWFTRLRMIGGRQAWTMEAPTSLNEAWLVSARAYNSVTVEIVPPGTWPMGARGLSGDALVEAFNARLRQVAESAVILRGRPPSPRPDPERTGVWLRPPRAAARCGRDTVPPAPADFAGRTVRVRGERGRRRSTMASGGPGHDEVARKIEEAREAVRRYREKESPVPLAERNEVERIERDDTGADGSLLGEGEALERLGADADNSGTPDPEGPGRAGPGAATPPRPEQTEAAD